MVDILVSHANEDNARIGALVEFLAGQNWSVWWNQEVPPGEALDMAIEAELESANIVVTVWSEHSVRSRLVRNTAYEAIESHCWIPIAFDAVRLPLRYREYQCIDMIGWPDQENPQAERSLAQFCQLLFRAGTSIALARDANKDLEMDARRPPIDQRKVGSSSALISAQGFGRQREFATIKLGDWTIEEGQNRIWREGSIKHVTPKSMQVLMYLIQNVAIPVSIDRILNHIWKDRVVVESVVHRCINELREAFEDDFKHPNYIETIPKRGYRIIAALKDQD